MAFRAETQELGIRFTADDTQLSRSVQRIDKRLGALSGTINRNLGKAIDTVLARGVRGLFGALNAGVQELKSDAVVFAQTEAVIASTGGAAGVTADQVKDLSSQLEQLNGVNDEVVGSAANVILRFEHIGGKTLPRVTQAAIDLAAATGGDAATAALKLGRALNDPIKNLSALSRLGIQFTDDEQKQITNLVKHNRLSEAQAIVLRKVERAYAGVAKKQADADPSKRLSIAIVNLQAAFATGLLPVIEKVQRRLTTAFSDKQTMQKVEQVGEAIGGLFTDENIDTVLGGIETAAKAVGTALNAFNQLPKEVKALAIGVFAVNKVTGGGVGAAATAFGKIVGAGFDKIFAAQVTVIGKNVTGGGLPGGGGGSSSNLPGNLAPMGIAAFLGTAALGAGLMTAVAGVERAITDGLSDALGGTGSVLGGLAKQVGDQVRRATLPIGDTLLDIPGAIDRTRDAISQIGDFLDSPHPDFLGDFGDLLMAQYGKDGKSPTKAQTDASMNDFRAGERDSAGGSISTRDPAVLKATKDLRARLEHQLGRLARAEAAGHNKVANRIREKVDALRHRIDAQTRKTASGLAEVRQKQAATIRAENATRDAVRHKRLNVSVNTQVQTQTSVAFSEVQRQARYTSRVVKSNRASVS